MEDSGAAKIGRFRNAAHNCLAYLPYSLKTETIPICPMLASGRCQQSWCTTVYYKAELGTQQHCRDNVTMFSGQKIVDYDIMTIFVVAYLYTEA